MDSEDVSTGTIEFVNGKLASFHLDYLSPTYTRYFVLYTKKNNKIISDDLYHINYPCNTMYVDEIAYFIDHVKNKKKCMNDVEEANYLIEKINNARKKS